MRYLRVVINTPYDSSYVYEPLDQLSEYTEKDLDSIAQDIFYNEYNYGFDVVDESDVPEHER